MEYLISLLLQVYPVFKVTAAVVLVLSPLIFHEMGHWALLRKNHIRIQEYWFGLGPSFLKFGNVRFCLFPVGAAVVPHVEDWENASAFKKLQVIMAGPIASFIFAAMFYIAATHVKFAQGTPFMAANSLESIGNFSLFLGIVNIVPIPPLDGFHMIVQWKIFKQKPFSIKHIRILNRLGNAIIYGGGALVIYNLLLKH